MLCQWIMIPMLVIAIGPGNEGTAVNDVVRGNNQFALDLQSRAGNQPGNVFFSPFSISSALAMTWSGARGETARQMAATLHLPDDRSTFEKGFAILTEQLDGSRPGRTYQIDSANALWGQSGYDYLEEFLRNSESTYHATLHPINFQADPEAARHTINAWIEQKTHEKIQNLLAQGSVRRDTDLILTNAIYFKAAWVSRFEKNRTRDEEFATEAGPIRTPLMHQSGRFRYREDPKEELQILELPYSSGDLSMVVLLPRKPDGLANLEQNLTREKLDTWIQSLALPSMVEVFLPRFKLEQKLELKKTLDSLGMKLVFGPDADFSGIASGRKLTISEVVHQAFVEVNEEGTEAAAATAVVMRSLAVRAPVNPPPVFRADHPFLFLIRENRSGTILFFGRLARPE